MCDFQKSNDFSKLRTINESSSDIRDLLDDLKKEEDDENDEKHKNSNNNNYEIDDDYNHNSKDTFSISDSNNRKNDSLLNRMKKRITRKQRKQPKRFNSSSTKSDVDDYAEKEAKKKNRFKTIWSLFGREDFSRLESQISNTTATTGTSNYSTDSNRVIELNELESGAKAAPLTFHEDENALLQSSISSSCSSSESHDTFNNNNKASRKAKTLNDTPSRSNSSTSNSSKNSTLNSQKDTLIRHKNRTHFANRSTLDEAKIKSDLLNRNLVRIKADELGRNNSFLNNNPSYEPSTKLVRAAAACRESSLTNTNSDYLEPVMNNVKLNFEYFGNQARNSSLIEYSRSDADVQQIIIMPEEREEDVRNKNSYYNDGILQLLESKRGLETVPSST